MRTFGQYGAHRQVADELVSGIDQEKFCGLFAEEGAGQLDSGDKAEPHGETNLHTVRDGVDARDVDDLGEHDGGDHAGDKREAVEFGGTFLHLGEFGFVVGIDAHEAHPGTREKDGGIPEESEDHGRNGGNENGQEIDSGKGLSSDHGG